MTMPEINLCERNELNINLDTTGMSRSMAACIPGNYYRAEEEIPLSVSLSDYKYLHFVCGEDTQSAGVQTLTIPLHTGKLHHRLTWDIADGILRPISKLFQCIIIKIDEEENVITIESSNVKDYGIRQIIAG